MGRISKHKKHVSHSNNASDGLSLHASFNNTTQNLNNLTKHITNPGGTRPAGFN